MLERIMDLISRNCDKLGFILNFSLTIFKLLKFLVGSIQKLVLLMDLSGLELLFMLIVAPTQKASKHSSLELSGQIKPSKPLPFNFLLLNLFLSF